jgi:hypothetical protein
MMGAPPLELGDHFDSGGTLTSGAVEVGLLNPDA